MNCLAIGQTMKMVLQLLFSQGLGSASGFTRSPQFDEYTRNRVSIRAPRPLISPRPARPPARPPTAPSQPEVSTQDH